MDDAHLLDASSAEALRFALRRMLAEPIGAVIAVREGEPSLLDNADIPTLAVAGLDRESSASLLGSVPVAVAERLYSATDGNPLALLELSRDASQLAGTPIDAPMPIPAKISRAFVRRAETLEDSTRHLLVLAAANDSGELSTLERAAASLGLELSGLSAAEQAGLIQLAPGRVEFRHPLARAALYSEATPEQRRDAHRALAAALPDRDLDRRAWHLAIASVGTDDAAASALEQSGARARGRSAYAVAARAFERAARLTGEEKRRGSALFAAADNAWLAGLADQAIALLAEAKGLDPNREQLIEIEHLGGRIATRQGPVMEGHRILVSAAERAAETDPDLAVTMLAEAVDACFFAGDAHVMEQTARRAQELLQAHASTRAQFLAMITQGMALVFAGDGRGGIEAIRDGVALAERSDELRDDAHLLPG